MIFGVRDLEVMLSNIYEFNEIRQREGRIVLMGVNEITLTSVL